MVRSTALLLTVLTGFAGLVYEVAWQKYLAALLGSHGEATAAVLAIFLGGLSIGYALFGRATRRVYERARRRGQRPRLLSFYGSVEAGIGLYALAFPILFGLTRRLSLLGPSDHEALAFAFDVVLSALLIGPPAVLMGGTISILTLALARDVDRATRVHAWVYGANTLGAFAGALAGGFWLVPRLGLDGVVRAMAGLNLAAALGFAVLERRASSVAAAPEPAGSAEPVPRTAVWSGIALLGALLGGYLLLIWFDLQHVFRISMACLAICAGVLSLLVLARAWRGVVLLGLLPTLAAIALLPPWPVGRFTPGTFRLRTPEAASDLGPAEFFDSQDPLEILFYDDDPTSSVAVGARPERRDNVALFVNGKPEGALQGEYPTTALIAWIPALLAGSHARAIGSGRLALRSSFYTGRVTPVDDTGLSWLDARRTTDLLANHFDHVIPFDPRLIDEISSRCTAKECETERTRAQSGSRESDRSAFLRETPAAPQAVRAQTIALGAGSKSMPVEPAMTIEAGSG